MRRVIIFLIRLYQRWLSPLLGARCRFYPTCSQYTVECFEQYGFFKATAKSMRRLLKCHPFHPGGWDPVTPGRHGPQQNRNP